LSGFSPFDKNFCDLSQKSTLQTPLFRRNTGALTGTKWVKDWQAADYELKAGEWAIGRFVLGDKEHFVLLDANKRVTWNSLDFSNCVEKGRLESLRVFRV
jgi:hypothetical protein